MTTSLEHALATGFTRADQLLLGDLIDVSAMALEAGIALPVAMSTRAHEYLQRTGRRRSRTDMPHAVLHHVGATLAKMGEPRTEIALIMPIQGLDRRLFVHLGPTEQSWVVTVYLDGEEPAPV